MGSMSREKARNYDKYRLPYAAEAAAFAVEFAMKCAGGKGIAVADLGAGTGLLTKHFIGKAETIYAIEPEPEMRNVAVEALGDAPGVKFMDGTAEHSNLPDGSVDLIVAANAYHRFQPERTIAEFARILKPDGVLAFFSYGEDDNFLRDTMQVANLKPYQERLAETRHQTPLGYFFGKSLPAKHLFRQEHRENWDEYWGAVASGMESPGGNEDWFSEFREAHLERFRRLAKNGNLTVAYSTEVWIGQPDYKL
ncbi:class I SAM-dependent methyltransferase [Fontibacillus sp. BL9]|uniref:class I SAM-dependent methyltransferase n=1 Tax=Fontibacillus sp. BL9 TaxID=3389971 RepID=UPI0039795882